MNNELKNAYKFIKKEEIINSEIFYNSEKDEFTLMPKTIGHYIRYNVREGKIFSRSEFQDGIKIGEEVILNDEEKVCQIEDKKTNIMVAVKPRDIVNSPPHYNSHPSGIECIEITQHMDFCIGNAMKYLWRCGKKDDDIQDLKKAVWYINKKIKILEGKK